MGCGKLLSGEVRRCVQTMLLCGMRDALLPAQYTGYECLQAQLKGRRRVVLVDPAQTFKGMYPYPCNHTYGPC